MADSKANDLKLYLIEFSKTDLHLKLNVTERGRFIGALSIAENGSGEITGRTKDFILETGKLIFNSSADRSEKTYFWLASLLIEDCFGEKTARQCVGALLRTIPGSIRLYDAGRILITQPELFVMMAEAQNRQNRV